MAKNKPDIEVRWGDYVFAKDPEYEGLVVNVMPNEITIRPEKGSLLTVFKAHVVKRIKGFQWRAEWTPMM